MATVVEVTVADHDVDDVSGRLWLAGVVAAIEERAGPEAGLVVLRVGVADGVDERAVGAALGGRWPWRVVTVDADAWIDDERARQRPVLVGERFLVQPPPAVGDDRSDPAPGSPRVVLTIDAAGTFGDASHPTTAMALEALAGLVQRGAAVLDVGCGSGVLAVAAAMAGAARVLAVDVDERAVDVARANVERNGVGARVEVRQQAADALGSVSGAYDVVLANLTAGILLDERAGVVGSVRSGGRLVLTGILAPRAAEVAGGYRELGCVVLDQRERDGWMLLVLERQPGVPGSERPSGG